MDDEPSAPIGYRLGGVWETTAFVGRGPVGEVHECRRSDTEGVFIAKLLPEELLESSETWASYLAAVSAAASLPTESTVRHVAFGSDLQLGCPFVVTERAPWPSLASLIKQGGPLKPKAWGKSLATLVVLLERAHAAELPHGRLTPTNVFVSPDDPGKVKVTDFGLGLACAARPGETLGGGVLGWAGPECEEVNAKPSPAGDVYSLGLLTFFALTGKRPFRALEAEQVHRKLLRSEMAASLKSAAAIAKKLGVELEPAFDKWFSRAIVPSPDARYSSVRLLGEAFEHVLRRLEPEKPTAAATKPLSTSLAASPPRPAQTNAPLTRGGASRLGASKGGRLETKAPAAEEASPGADALDDQPTIKLNLDTLFAGAQPTQSTAPASEVATRKAAPVAPRAASARAFTALAPPIASPAPPPAAPAAPVAVIPPPVAVIPPPVAVIPPPVAVIPPPVAVTLITGPAPELALAPPPTNEALASATPSSSGPVSAPIVGMPVRAVGESTRVEPAPAQAFAESTPAQFNPAALITPQDSGTGVPAVVTASPQLPEAGTAAASARLVSRPKAAVAIGVGLLLLGLVVGIVIGERRGKSEAPVDREPARTIVTEATTQAPSPPVAKPDEPKPPTPEAALATAPVPSLANPAPPADSAPALASTQPSAGPALASASPAAPASASVAASATTTAATKAPDIVVMPVPTATTNATKSDATKSDATKSDATKSNATKSGTAPARKKPCGTFINPCQ
jgi:serine/threonine protein kinase